MAIDIDGVLVAIGETGPYQKRIYFLLCLPVIFVGAANLAYIFIAATPRYRCIVEGCDNSSHAIYDASFLNFTIPYDERAEELNSCYRYMRLADAPRTGCSASYFSKNIEECRDGIVFDKTVYESTAVTEFNLTCHDSWEASADQSVYFSGILVGCFFFGLLADAFGRRLVILTCIVMMSISGVVVVFVPNIYSLHVLRFINALSSAGLFQTAFILGLEFVGPNKRVMFGSIGQYFFALGEILLGITAFAVRDWRMLQLIISAPVICFIFYYWVVPESIRWLQTKGRHLQVISSLENVARINKKIIPLNLLAHQSVDEDLMENMELTDILTHRQKISVCDVLKTPALFFRLFFMIFIWITTTLCYYGLSYSTQSIKIGDRTMRPFIFFTLSAVVELPGYTFAWFGMQYLGRKWSLSGSFFLAGAATIANGYMKSFLGVLMVFLLGKCFMTCAFSIIYIFTAELFPTSVRNTFIGTCSMFARIGGILAPFADTLKSIYTPLPMLVFGGMSILSGVFSLTMPETKGTRLPDTLIDAVNLGKERMNYRSSDDELSQRLISDDQEDDILRIEDDYLDSHPESSSPRSHHRRHIVNS